MGEGPPVDQVGRSLDRRCLAEPAQLGAVAAKGTTSDLKVLLARPPQRWRERDQAGLDTYDRALIRAAGNVRPDAVKLLLQRLVTRPHDRLAGDDVLERAMLASLDQEGPTSDADRVETVGALLDAGGRLEFEHDGVQVSFLAEAVRHAASASGVPPLVGYLLRKGADPNGPACVAGRESDPPALYWALGNEPLFDRLIEAGATPLGHACPSDAGKPSLTSRSVKELARDGGAEARLHTSIKLLKAGGHIGPALRELPLNNLSPNSASIIVAAHELSGRRDEILRDLVVRAQAPGARVDPETRAALIRWSTCPHGPPVLEADHAELCGKVGGGL